MPAQLAPKKGMSRWQRLLELGGLANPMGMATPIRKGLGLAAGQVLKKSGAPMVPRPQWLAERAGSVLKGLNNLPLDEAVAEIQNIARSAPELLKELSTVVGPIGEAAKAAASVASTAARGAGAAVSKGAGASKQAVQKAPEAVKAIEQRFNVTGRPRLERGFWKKPETVSVFKQGVAGKEGEAAKTVDEILELLGGKGAVNKVDVVWRLNKLKKLGHYAVAAALAKQFGIPGFETE